MKFRRLTPQERKRLGVSKGSKQRVNADVKRVTRKTKLYSDRQVATIKLKARIGRTITKEQFTDAVKSGEAKYASASTVLQQKHARFSRAILKLVPEMVPRDLALANRWHDVGYDGLSGRTPNHKRGIEATGEKKAFGDLFVRYEADAVREAFGSERRDTGSYNIAA